MKGPLALVGSLSGGRGRRGGRRAATVARRMGALAGKARRVPQGIEKVVAGPLPKTIAKRVPSRRKRRAIVKRVKRDVDRLSALAGGVSTALGLAAATAEIVSAARSQNGHGEQERGGARDEDERLDDEDAEDEEFADGPEGGEAEDFEEADEPDEDAEPEDEDEFEDA